MKTHYEFNFKHVVKMSKSDGYYRVYEISHEDQRRMNKIFKQMDSTLKMTINEISMTGLNIKFKDDPIDLGSQLDLTKWKLKVQIRGFRTDIDGQMRPLMNIRVARLVTDLNL